MCLGGLDTAMYKIGKINKGLLINLTHYGDMWINVESSVVHLKYNASHECKLCVILNFLLATLWKETGKITFKSMSYLTQISKI